MEPSSLHPMIRLLTCIHSISSHAVLLMTETDWRFHVSAKHVSGNTPQVYGNVAINQVFVRYVIESQSNNEILLEIDISQLLRVFQVCAKTEEHGSEITLKLTTKNTVPLLAFSIWSDNNQALLVSQGIPVTTLASGRKEMYEPPKLRAPDAQIKMPELRAFKTMLDKMQSVSELVTFKVSHDGKCEVEAENDWAKIETVYQELAIESAERSHTQKKMQWSKQISNNAQKSFMPCKDWKLHSLCCV